MPAQHDSSDDSSDNDNDDQQQQQSSSPKSTTKLTELQHIQSECTSMTTTLKQLHDQEIKLRLANELLAQQAILMGCTGGLDGGTKRARKKPGTGAASAAAAAKKKKKK